MVHPSVLGSITQYASRHADMEVDAKCVLLRERSQSEKAESRMSPVSDVLEKANLQAVKRAVGPADGRSRWNTGEFQGSETTLLFLGSTGV
jgi:hypothetical protein